MIGFAPPLVYVSSLALTELQFIAAVLASLGPEQLVRCNSPLAATWFSAPPRRRWRA